jgi:hypothetical protein
MKSFILGAALAASCLAMSGCAQLAGFNAALVPELKPISAGIEPTIRCADLADRVAAADDMGKLSGTQLRALYRSCEEMQSDQRVLIDPGGARKVLNQALIKSPVAAVAAAAVAHVGP